MNEDFKCRYCGLVFDNRKLLKEHIERECVGKVIYQKTTIMGRLEKFFEKIKHERDVYDIKKGMEVLRKMEELRKEGKIPVIKIRDSKELEELKKVINFRGEVVYLSNVDEEILNEVIKLEPKAAIGNFSEREKEILESSGISI
ncbi:MAG TPA: C2H2-type zinc finger protein, partial [Candidatus Aenigmarchaeota archaeon]|nr:C2H2-type zinc finger protein [Candidatus Aenigmarchaeota archaeon]